MTFTESALLLIFCTEFHHVALCMCQEMSMLWLHKRHEAQAHFILEVPRLQVIPK